MIPSTRSFKANEYKQHLIGDSLYASFGDVLITDKNPLELVIYMQDATSGADCELFAASLTMHSRLEEPLLEVLELERSDYERIVRVSCGDLFVVRPPRPHPQDVR